MSETKRQQQKELTRKKIINTALDYYGKNGILATRTIDIAKAASVSHGTIFAHFPTQEELLTAVIEEFGNRISKKLHELLDTDKTLVEILQSHITSLIEFEQFYTRLVIERRMLPESARNTYIMIQSTISFHIGAAAEKEMDQGKLRKMPVHLLFNTWIGIIHYYITNSDLFSSDGHVLEKYSQELLTHYITLISK